jgi:hypothetical protein
VVSSTLHLLSSAVDQDSSPDDMLQVQKLTADSFDFIEYMMHVP